MDQIKALIDQYGPAVVAAAQKQVQVAIAQDWAWAIFGTVLCLFILGVTVAIAVSSDSGFDAATAGVVGGFVVLVVGLFFVAQPLGEIWTYSANPDYAVIKIVRQMVLAK